MTCKLRFKLNRIPNVCQTYGCAFNSQSVCIAAGSVRMKPLTSKASDAEMEKEIKEWLKFALERSGARKERNDKKQKSVTSAAVE